MKVVGIGGGHGLAVTLKAARLYAREVSAVVTVADDGGSSGRLTTELGIPPPGDIRNCLVALADGSDLAATFQHRFTRGALEGHPIGNLIIAALAEEMGDFGLAVQKAGRMLGAQGRVFPATTELVGLSALVEGGVVEGQVAVATSKHPIRSVHLRPSTPEAYPQAVDAILGADQIVVGPGSLYTSVIATLLVPGINKALAGSPAHRVFVCNARQQPGETEGMTTADHVRALLGHTGPSSIDTVVVQEPAVEGGVTLDAAEVAGLGLVVVTADVVSADGAHDPGKLAKVLAALPSRVSGG
ncbi:MAG: gluconeogenesis factor YvcK family protein [Actinomycetota bacterium]